MGHSKILLLSPASHLLTCSFRVVSCKLRTRRQILVSPSFDVDANLMYFVLDEGRNVTKTIEVRRSVLRGRSLVDPPLTDTAPLTQKETNQTSSEVYITSLCSPNPSRSPITSSFRK